MKNKKWLQAGACLCITLCAVAVGLSGVHAETAGRKRVAKAASGIYIGDIDVSGMNKQEITQAVNDYIETFTDKKVTLKVDGKEADVSVGDLGYYWSNKNIVKEVLEHANRGNVIERYKEQQDINKNNIKYDIEVAINQDTLKQAINDNCSKYNIPHVNAGLKKSGDSFTIGASSTGRKIAVKKSMEELTDYLLDKWDGKSDIEFDLVVVDDKPVSTEEDCKLVKDVLGSFSTSFSTGGSNYYRNMNMKNGMEHINSAVVYPGEVFSANALLEPWTEDNGWYPAGTYVNGKVENSLGGGICQVSTTLYNAVLLSELEVVERFPHSMSVGYVGLAADAALAGTYKDLKFKNNTDAPVYVEGVYSDEGRLTFTIYGHETRDAGRSLKFVSEKISENYPGEVRTEDPSKPAGYRVVTVSGHVGYTAKLWKEIYQDGKLVDRQLVNTSTYQSSPIYVTYGTGTETAEPATDGTPEPDTKPKETKKQEETKRQKQTKKETKKAEETTRKQAETEPAA